MIRDTLSRHNLQPDSDRDQHFLDDPQVLQTMIEAANLMREDTVLDVGAGIGTITAAVAAQAGKVIAYENDPVMAAVLREELSGYDNTDIYAEDVMDADIPDFDVCVSNPPFHLSSPLIELLGGRNARAVLLLQKEFAERLVAEPGTGEYSRITIRTRYHFTPVFLETVPGTAFLPPAKVDAALVQLYPRNEAFDIDEEFFFTVVTALFTHKRKKVRNAFYDSRHFFDLSKEDAKMIQDDIPFSEERAITLDIYELVEIADAVQQRLKR